MKNTFQFFVSKAKAFKKGPSQMHFPGLKPKSRRFRGKFSAKGDARGISLIAVSTGAGAVGVGEGVRRARTTKNKRGKNGK